MSLKIDKIKQLIGVFPSFSLPVFQNKEQYRKVSSRRVIWLYNTVNSDIGRRTQSSSLREGWVGIPRHIYSENILESFCQSTFQFQCCEKRPQFSATNRPPQVRSINALSLDGKFKLVELNIYDFDLKGISRLKTLFRNSGSAACHCTLKN